jgi:hypothetical protein
MNFVIEVLVYGGIVPAAIAVAIVCLSRRFLPESVSNRYAAAIAFAVAFFVGYALLPSWADLLPKRHWQWLPYLGAVAVVLGPVGLATGVRAPERWLLFLLLAIATAWALVPTWPGLKPPRSVYVPCLAGYLLLLTTLLEPLPARLIGKLFVALLTVVSGSVAIALAAFVSLKFGQVAGIAAAATAGCWVASLFHNHDSTTRGLVPAFTIVVGGLAFVGFIEPQQPLKAMLLVPAAPLALWASVWGPLARLRGIAAGAAQTAIVLVPLAIALIWLLFGEGAGQTDGY